MRREDYERTYGRRSHIPPPLPSPQEDPRSRRSRTKMKCLISIGLILPALAAVIGVAAWAVSADVVMNSGNNKADNHMLQSFPLESDNRRDIFRANEESQRHRPQHPSPIPTTESTTTTTTTTTQPTTTTTSTTTTKSTTAASVTLSPKEENDVNAIISKLISASGAATGGSGPRFVVVAPLPDTPDAFQNSGSSSSSAISRADHSTKPHSRDNSWQVSGQNLHDQDLMTSSSQNKHQLVPHKNLTNRVGTAVGDGSSNRRIGPQPIVISASDYHSGNSFNGPQIEITGFDPFDSMMQDALVSSQSAPKVHQTPHHQAFSNKRGPPQGLYGNRKPLPMQHFDPKPQHVFEHHPHEHNKHSLIGSHAPGMLAHSQGLGPPPGIGMKPIQKQLHHQDPLQTAESTRWGYHGPPSGAYHHKPPEGISLSISSPSHSGTHVSSEPVSVIKSFFLPFLPKPRLNMNARVVFGVVLDKGMGLGGGKKDAGHPPYH